VHGRAARREDGVRASRQAGKSGFIKEDPEMLGGLVMEK